MKYGLLSLGIFTTLQTITFIYYIYKPLKPTLLPKEEDVTLLPEEEEVTLLLPEQDTLPETKKNILNLLQKHKDNLIKYNEEIIKIQNEILILRDKLSN